MSLLFLVTTNASSAAVRYVNLNNPTPASPYTNWSTAATTIQDAVDAALPGDEIVVTNGTYSPVDATKTLTLQSVNGPEFTLINGNGGSRCVTLASGATLMGFTLTNGGTFMGWGERHPEGGGVWCESKNTVVSNCTITGNRAFGSYGGGAYGGTLINCTLANNGVWNPLGGWGGGAAFSTLYNCRLTENSAAYGGGAYDSTLNNCTLTENSAGYGGGANGGTLSHCLLTGNSASRGGGAYEATLNYCVLLTNTAVVSGGGASGGEGRIGTLNNCTLTSNRAYSARDEDPSRDGFGGGADSITLNNCTLSRNSAKRRGGGAAFSTLNNCVLASNGAESGGGAYQCTLNNCTLTGNNAGTSGGGTFECTLNRCIISTNSAGRAGGGIYGGTLNYCILTANAAQWGGGAAGLAEGGNTCTLNNCLLTRNRADLGRDWRHGGASAGSCILNNCTLTFNSAGRGGGVSEAPAQGGIDSGALYNCIVYYNTSDSGVDPNYTADTRLYFSCTTPLPWNGVGNINCDPLFVDLASGDLRLQSDSPCINAGRNASAPAELDLDGLPRVAGGTVDVGAYEFQNPSSTLSQAWLQRFGIPTDGSADFADADGDGFINDQEWRAGTDPTDAASILRLFPPSFDGTQWLVSWPTVPGRAYTLERSIDLGATPRFTPVAVGVPGQPGMTSVTDTHPTTSGPVLYRLRVEE